MGFSDFRKRLMANDTERHAERLRARLSPLDVVPIDELGPRQVRRFGGEVKRIGCAPRQGVPALEVVVSDGTGDAVAVFTGRRAIGGVDHGRLIVLEGIVREERGRKVVLNPAYTLVADDHGQ
jgi:hypothetical protein